MLVKPKFLLNVREARGEKINNPLSIAILAIIASKWMFESEQDTFVHKSITYDI